MQAKQCGSAGLLVGLRDCGNSLLGDWGNDCLVLNSPASSALSGHPTRSEIFVSPGAGQGRGVGGNPPFLYTSLIYPLPCFNTSHALYYPLSQSYSHPISPLSFTTFIGLLSPLPGHPCCTTYPYRVFLQYPSMS